MRSRLRARHVVGYDGTDHCLLRDGEVVWADDRIVYVGPSFPGSVDRSLDCGQAVILPGFVDLNALGDIDHAVFDSFQPSRLLAGQEWSLDHARHRRTEVFDRDELAFRREYALVQLLLNGITTALPIAAETYREWAETAEEFEDLISIASRLGNRLYLGPSYRSGVSVVDSRGRRRIHWDEDAGRRGLRDAVRFVERWDGAVDGRIRGMLAPARVETQTPDQLLASRAASDELSCPLRLHAGQSHEEIFELRAAYDARPVEVLDRFDVLGPRTLLPHAWAVDGHSEVGPGPGADLARLAASGATVVFCPMAAGRYAMVMESFDRYHAAGVRLGLGTDTFPPDMLRAIDQGSVLTKTVERRQDAGQIADLFRAATLGGAAALGREDIGRLAPGAKADIVVVSLDDLRTGPIDDPIRTVVMNASGSFVRHVVVDGRYVVREGQVPGVDANRLRDRAQELFDRYRESFSDRDYRGRSTEDLMPPTFRQLTGQELGSS